MNSLLRFPWEGYRHDTYSFIGNDFFVSGGAYGILEAYDYNTNLISRFVGHEGDIRSITTSANGNFMITSGTDMTMRLWPINEIGKNKGDVNSIYPVVSIFIAENNEWVIWNNEGYFTSSKKGAKYVGYHVNQVKGKEAKFYPFDQFNIKYNRPDIILKSLGVADSGTIDLYERAYKKGLKRMGMTDDDLQVDSQAPNLNIVSYQVTGSILKLDIKASDEKYNWNRINIFINDVPIYGRRGLEMKDKTLQNYTSTLNVELMNGENKVQVSVLNNNGVESLRETVYATSNQTAAGDLYMISIGVSNYKDTKFNLNYAAKDAQDMVNAFEENTVYETVHQKIIINEKVTCENIFELKEFLKSAKTNDVVMLFTAGHGVLYRYGICISPISK